jgi:hypothetical protein
MCGIAGWVSYVGDLRAHQDVITTMTKTMARRGPDAGGIWIDTPPECVAVQRDFARAGSREPNAERRFHGENTGRQINIPHGTSGTENPQDTFLKASGARTIVVIQQQFTNFFPPNAI